MYYICTIKIKLLKTMKKELNYNIQLEKSKEYIKHLILCEQIGGNFFESKPKHLDNICIEYSIKLSKNTEKICIFSDNINDICKKTTKKFKVYVDYVFRIEKNTVTIAFLFSEELNN